MKWISHKTTAVSYCLFANLNLPQSFCVVLGSTLPDAIEHMLAGNNINIFIRIHRKFFHWILFYIVLFLLFYLAIKLPFHLNIYIAYIMLGAIIHLIGDLFTKSGIPLLNPFKNNFKFPLFKTGSLKEYIVVFLLLISSIYWRFYVHV